MSNLREEQSWIVTGSLMILALYATGAMLIYTQSVMIPFVLALLIVTLVAPAVDYQVNRLHWPQWVAVGVVMTFVLAFMSLMGMVAYHAVQAVTANIDSIGKLVGMAVDRLARWNIIVDKDSLETDLTKMAGEFLTTSIGPMLDMVTKPFTMSIFIIFLLLGRNTAAVKRGVYADIDRQVRRYIGIKVALSATTGTLVWIVLAAMGLKLASVFGLLAFMLNFIPIIGSVIATLLPIPIAVAQFDGFWAVLAVVAVPAAIQQIIGNGVEPKVLGTELSLHPVTIVFALAVWGLLWGPTGMLLAVPITAILRIVLMQFDSVRPIGRLLGGELPGTRSDVAVQPM